MSRVPHFEVVGRDAARYRSPRDRTVEMLRTVAPMVASLDESGNVVGLLVGEELDKAVDAILPGVSPSVQSNENEGKEKTDERT